jgi:hypothetical protein
MFRYAMHKDSPLRQWHYWAVLAWWISLMVVGGRVLLFPEARTVYATYAEAGHAWRAGANLYDGGYRYSPAMTPLFAGLSYLPDGVAGALWRWLGAAVLLVGLLWWVRRGFPRPMDPARQGLLFLLVAPLALPSLNNGQANILLTGLLVIAVTAAAERRWNLTALCLALSCLLKIYPLAIALLLLALYPRQLGWRLALALALGLALPFLFQEPRYVMREYHDFVGKLWDDDRSAWNLKDCYRDLWLLCRVWGIPVSRALYHGLQLAAAGGLAILVLIAGRAGWNSRRLLNTLLALGCCWMMLLGPCTESCTYSVLAPSLAAALVEGFCERRPLWFRGGVLVSYVLLLAALIAAWFPFGGSFHALGLLPLGALALSGTLLAQAVAGLWRPDRGGPLAKPHMLRRAARHQPAARASGAARISPY